MAKFEHLEIVAPRLLDGEFNEATVFGSAAWLWMHSDRHKNIPLHTLSTLLLPAIKHRKFLLASENGKPIFFVSWADLSEEAEMRYIKNSPEQMRDEDWCSGERMWILDWIAPFGHNNMMFKLMTRKFFAGLHMRTLYHRGSETGLKIKQMRGMAVLPEEANLWFERHPTILDQKKLR